MFDYRVNIDDISHVYMNTVDIVFNRVIATL